MTGVTTQVLVGLGSNQGDSPALILAAMARLGAFAAGQVRCSSLWRTSPVDCAPGTQDFFNAAAAFLPAPGLSPELLAAALKQLELELAGGGPRQRNAPRALDLDLVLFADQIRQSPALILPHPRAWQRLFVLAPALQVAPDSFWPGIGQTTRMLYEQARAAGNGERVMEWAADTRVSIDPDLGMG